MRDGRSPSFLRVNKSAPTKASSLGMASEPTLRKQREGWGTRLIVSDTDMTNKKGRRTADPSPPSRKSSGLGSG